MFNHGNQAMLNPVSAGGPIMLCRCVKVQAKKLHDMFIPFMRNAVVLRAFVLLKGLDIFVKKRHLVTFSKVKRTPIYFFFPYFLPHLDGSQGSADGPKKLEAK
jgi:hypothetical protein